MTKMKGLPQYLSSLALFCLNFTSILQAEGLTPEQLLAEKRDQLNRFVRAVEENSRNCSALIGCSSSGDGCSRLACYNYGTQGHSNYQCLGVADNSKLCGSQCKERNFDFSKGFVRRMDIVNKRIARTVCTHRALDDHFRSSNLTNSSHFFRVFFGSVDGTSRLYPGVDEDCIVENEYDPRIRPWFLESTHVSKGVTILIDSGLNMRNELDGGNDKETYISKAITTALKSLETLREGTDYVNIMCFDGDGMKPPNAKSTIYYRTLQYQSFNDSLTEIVNGVSTKDPSATNTSNAINYAISELTINSSPVPAHYLKVVLVLTSGQQFQTLSELNISASLGANVFLYNFINRPNRIPHECNSPIRASSEFIEFDRFDNPLYALQSYYSFLAKIHRGFMGNQTDYGQKYEDASGIDDHTLTLSKAAFGPNGEIIGVVGIDFFEKKVEEQYKPMQFQLIVAAINKLYRPKSFNASKDLKTSVCFNFTDPCPDMDVIDDGLCQKNNGDANIGCCGKCKPKKSEWPKIVGGVFGGIGGVVAIIAAIVCFIRPCTARRLERNKTEGPTFVFNGPDNEPIDQVDTTGNTRQRAPE